MINNLIKISMVLRSWKFSQQKLKISSGKTHFYHDRLC